MDREVTAYPEVEVSGGAGAKVSLRYAESLWIPGTQQKGNRNQVDLKEMRGVRDSFQTDGGGHRVFRPLWWRAFRFVEVSVETAEQPLTIESLRGSSISYPFEQRAKFKSDAPEWLNRILDVGRRTNQLSSQETYLDAIMSSFNMSPTPALRLWSRCMNRAMRA